MYEGEVNSMYAYIYMIYINEYINIYIQSLFLFYFY